MRPCQVEGVTTQGKGRLEAGLSGEVCPRRPRERGRRPQDAQVSRLGKMRALDFECLGQKGKGMGLALGFPRRDPHLEYFCLMAE